MSEIKKSIQESGFATLDIDVQDAEIRQLAEQFIGVLALNDEWKNIGNFTPKRGAGSFGLKERRRGQQINRGISLDEKDVFHFGSQTRQIVESRADQKPPKVLKDFLDSCERLFWNGVSINNNAFRQLTDSEETGKLLCPENGNIDGALRLIAYHGEQNLASAHFDRSVSSIMYGQSHKGTHIAPGQNERKIDMTKDYIQSLDQDLRHVDITEGQAQFLLGAGYNRLQEVPDMQLEALPLGWHKVQMQESTARHSDEIAAFAVVQFFNVAAGTAGYVVPSPTETRPYKLFS